MESNPYLEARRDWDERYADLVLGKRNWQIAAGGLLLLSLILAGGFVWLSTRSKFVPYVLEVEHRSTDGQSNCESTEQSQHVQYD